MAFERAAVVLVYLVFGALLNGVGTINLLATRTMGVSPAEAALLDACKDLPIAAVSLLLAPFLPRFGLKRGTLVALGLLAAGCALMPALESFRAIQFLFVAIGAAFAIVKVSTYATVGLLTRDARSHASFMNVLEGAFMLGVMGGYGLFALAIDEAHPASTSWLRVYGVFALVLLLVAALMSRTRIDETAVRDAAPPSIAHDAGTMAKLLASSLVIVYLASAFLYVLLEQGIGTWLPSFNAQVLHMPASMSVGLAVIMPLGTCLGRLASALVLARVSWHRVVQACLVVVAALIVVTIAQAGRAHLPTLGGDWLHAPFVAFLFPLIGVFLAPIYPAINSAMLSRLPGSRHAAMTGLLVVFSALGGSTGSFITGRLFAAFDGRTAFALLLVPLAVLSAALWGFARGLARPAALPTDPTDPSDPARPSCVGV